MLASLPDEAECERRFAAAASGPLRGIPAMAKDMYPVAGYPMRAGSVFLHEERPAPARDANLLQDWRAAGGVLAGLTQLHEFAYGITGENPHYGNVAHPARSERTSGGSSSGSAVAVKAGLVPLAFGTDTAGSLRVPAAYCGLHSVRFAPRERWIEDVFPLAPGFDTAGWFTADATSMQESLTALGLAPSAAKGLRVGWLALPGVDPQLLAVQEARARSLGAEDLPAPLAGRLLEAWRRAPAVFRALRAPEAWQVHAGWFNRREAQYDPKVRLRLLDGLEVTPEEQERARVEKLRLGALFNEAWQYCDALALPCTPTVALRHEDCTQAERDRIFLLTTAVSVAGLPALTVPISLPERLSTGLQIAVPASAASLFHPLLERSLNTTPEP